MSIVTEYSWEDDTFTHHTNGTAAGAGVSDYDADLDQLYSWMPPQAPPAPPCPEALFSCTMEGAIDGHKTLLTARGQTVAEFKANLEAIRGVLDAVPQPTSPAVSQPQHPLTPQQQNAAAMHKPVVDFCPIHQVQMKANHKDGRQWYSHYDETAGRWCKGR